MPKEHGERLSLEERRIIEKMVSEQHNFSSIARTLDRAVTTISHEIKSQGGLTSYSAEKAHKARQSMGAKGFPRATELDIFERKIIEQMLQNNCTHNAIANVLKRSQAALSREIKKNGGRSGYNAETAQARADSRRGKADKKRYNLKTVEASLLSRVGILEMQLEIILDQLKELKCHKF